MSLSKIVKKDRVVLNEGRYTIPVSNINKVADSNSENTDETSAGTTDLSDLSGSPYLSDLSDESDKNNAEYPESDAQDIPQDSDRRDRQSIQNSHNNRSNQGSPYHHIHQNANYREPVRTERGKVETVELIGEEIIAQAQKTAEIIISHTLESTKQELDIAITQGYNDGYSEGKSEALKIIEPSLLKIKILVDSIKKMQDKMLDEFKDGMFNMISDISSKILHKEIDEKDEYLVELFADAVKNIKTESFVTVTVSGAQIDFTLRNIDLFRSQVANINDFKIVPDKNAVKGTMVVETANALADASYAVQQEKINLIISQMKENLSVLESSEEIIPPSGMGGNINSMNNDGNVGDDKYTDSEQPYNDGYSENYDGDIKYDNTDNGSSGDKMREEFAPVP